MEEALHLSPSLRERDEGVKAVCCLVLGLCCLCCVGMVLGGQGYCVMSGLELGAPTVWHSVISGTGRATRWRHTPRGLCHIDLMDVSTLTILTKWYHRVYGLPPSVVFVVDRQDGVYGT